MLFTQEKVSSELLSTMNDSTPQFAETMNIQTLEWLEKVKTPENTEGLLSLVKKYSSNYIGFISGIPTISNIKRSRQFFKPNAFHGYSLSKNVATIIQSHPNSAPDLFVTDSNGVIKNSLENNLSALELCQDAKKTSKPIILFFGGSTIMGDGSMLPEYSIPSQVEKLLLYEFGVQSCCINFGVSGYSSLDSFNLLNTSIINDYKPDLILFYDGWNCYNYFSTKTLIEKSEKLFNYYGSNSSQGFYSFVHNHYLEKSYSFFWLTKYLAFLGIVNILSNLITLFRVDFVKHLLIKVISKIPSLAGPGYVFNALKDTYPIDEKSKIRISEESAQIYIAIHKDIEKVCASNQIECITCLQPLLFAGSKPPFGREFQILEDADMEGLKTFYKSLNNFFTNHSKRFNLSSVFNETDAQVYLDTGHLNAYGNFVIADSLAKTVRQILNT